MRKRLFLAAAGLIMAAIALGAIACSNDNKNDNNTPTATGAYATPSGGETPQANAVDVRLLEFKILPEPASASAGSVTFNARNIGAEAHELVVLKTDLDGADLPTNDDGSVDEAGAGIEIIGEIQEIAAGAEKSASFDLEPGNYVLLCNIVDEMPAAGETPMATGEATGHVHYAEGMYAAFTVE